MVNSCRMDLHINFFFLQALMSLFVLSSKDGWVNIMYDGLDAVGIDQQVDTKDPDPEVFPWHSVSPVCLHITPVNVSELTLACHVGCDVKVPSYLLYLQSNSGASLENLMTTAQHKRARQLVLGCAQAVVTGPQQNRNPPEGFWESKLDFFPGSHRQELPTWQLHIPCESFDMHCSMPGIGMGCMESSCALPSSKFPQPSIYLEGERVHAFPLVSGQVLSKGMGKEALHGAAFGLY